MSITTIILVILVIALVGALPTWNHSAGYGWGPSGIVGTLLVILLVLFLLGKI